MGAEEAGEFQNTQHAVAGRARRLWVVHDPGPCAEGALSVVCEEEQKEVASKLPYGARQTDDDGRTDRPPCTTLLHAHPESRCSHEA